MRTRRGQNKEIRAEMEILERLGYSLDPNSPTGLLAFHHPDHGRFVLHATPSDWRWRENHRAKLAAHMGTTKGELELRLGLRPPKHVGPRVRRERNDAGRQARRFEIVRDVEPKKPARIGTPQERMAEIARDRKEAEGRQARAAVGSDAYRCALDDISRCRREWLEAEIAMKAAA